MIKMLSVRKMKAILEKLSLLPWLAPYALLAYGYLLLLYKAGFHIPVLLIFSFPILMLIFIFLHSHADMTLDSDCDYDEGLIASIKCFFNCYFFCGVLYPSRVYSNFRCYLLSYLSTKHLTNQASSPVN